MIPEYQQLSAQISERVQRVGRLIQKDHYIMEFTPFPAVSPFMTGIQAEHVLIAVGKDNTSTVHVAFPIGLFETAGDADIAIWCHVQNAQRQKAQEESEIEAAAHKRLGEVKLMVSLMQKYPEEAGSLRTAIQEQATQGQKSDVQSS